jgi:hypothetical protein
MQSGRFTMTIDDIINNGFNIFDFDYEIKQHNDKPTKEDLEGHFIRRYRFREICYETYDMWHEKFKDEWCYKLTKYNHIWGKFMSEDGFNILDSQKESSERENVYEGKQKGSSKTISKATPIDSDDDSTEFASGLSKADTDSDSESSSAGKYNNVKTLKTELEMFNDFLSKYKDPIDAFTDEFDNMFLHIA